MRAKNEIVLMGARARNLVMHDAAARVLAACASLGAARAA
jgi:hypothetical protein